MPMFKTSDGTNIFYKDWGPRDAPVIAFHHGWPLSSDDWDNQLMFFLQQGYRVLAHDRRGHGRSDQTDGGHTIDTYAADAIELYTSLGLRNASHVGHSTGGGEVTRFVARSAQGAVARAVLISAIPPVMVRKESNPKGTPIEVFDELRRALADNRSQMYLDTAAGPFYNYNRPGIESVDGNVHNWWRQGMMGGIKAHYDGIKAWSETDLTEDLKQIDVPVLLIHSRDDQIVPYEDAAPLAVKLLRNGILKTYEGLPHGCMTTHPDLINADVLAFLRGEAVPGAVAPAEAEPVPA